MLTEIDSSDACDGIDLSQYQNDLAKQRSAQSISIRRTFQSDEATPQSRLMKPLRSPRLQTLDEPEVKIDDVSDAFQSHNIKIIQAICSKITQEQNSQLIAVIIENDEVLDMIANVANLVCSNSSDLQAYLNLILSLADKENANNMLTDVLIQTQSILDSYPFEMLSFYRSLCNVSSYGRDAILCTGISYSIFLFCEKAEDAKIAVLASSVIHAIFSCNEIIANEVLRDYLESVINLLNVQNEDVIYYIILSLIDIVSQDRSLIDVLYQHNVHAFLVKALDNEKLIKPSICLAANLANGESSQIEKLFQIELIPKILLLPNDLLNGDAFFMLSNCAEAAMDQMLPIFDFPFLQKVKILLTDCPYSVFKDASFFLATLLVFAPMDRVKMILQLGVTDFINQMFESDQPFMILRGLDALVRVIIFSYTFADIKEEISQFFLSEDLKENIEKLKLHEINLISRKALSIEKYIIALSNDLHVN